MTHSLLKAIQDYSIPFEKNDDLSAILESIGDANIVLLGEASHGTSEFYSVRAEISKAAYRGKRIFNHCSRRRLATVPPS